MPTTAVRRKLSTADTALARKRAVAPEDWN
jgi:hypothetical protein